MPNALLTVVAELVAKPGKEDELKRTLLSLIEPTRKEDDCVQYDLHQSTNKAGHFLFYETWRSPEALERTPRRRTWSRLAASGRNCWPSRLAL